MQLPARILRRSKSLVPITDHPPQCHNLVFQSSDAGEHRPDLDVEGIALTVD
jgi:hypothetical protein